MFDRIRQIFAGPQADPEPATVPAGQRVYAIGDVHGRLDLFAALVAAVEADDAARAPAESTIVLLGDLVDRGPDSAGVLRAARELQQRRPVRILCGNHEEMFLDSFTETEVLRHFLRHGGRETLASFGLDLAAGGDLALEEVQQAMHAAVPPAERAFLAGFEDAIAIGGYLFVHAGVEPDQPLDQQDVAAMRWIREPFLSHKGPFGAVVVHGHTIVEDAQMHPNRIAIDTGAYMSGRLTALALEGGSRRFIQAIGDESGAIAVVETVPGGL